MGENASDDVTHSMADTPTEEHDRPRTGLVADLLLDATVVLRYERGERDFRDLAARPKPCTLNFEKKNLDGADFSGIRCLSFSAMNASLRKAVFRGFVGSTFDSGHSDTSFWEAELEGADFTNASLVRASFNRSVLRGACFRGADLRSATFDGADLSGADLRGCVVDDGTLLQRANVEGCQIDRFTLESLSERGKLTAGAVMTMKIEDGVATLRADYSGFWQWIHLFALALFLAPYVTFVIKETLFAHVRCDASPCAPLWQVLVEYVWTGGRFDGPSWSFPLVLFALLYNVLRGALLYKTKTLELEQESRGMPVRFSLTGGWARALRAAHIGFKINVLVVVIHTWHFLQTSVPTR